MNATRIVDEGTRLDRVTRHRFTVEQVMAMEGSGILKKGNLVELIDGELIELAPVTPWHSSNVMHLMTTFSWLPAEDTAMLAARMCLRLSASTLLMPDFAILRHNRHRYRLEYPSPADVLLLAELSDTTRRLDREVKLPLYAAAGIREVWIVDAESRTVDSYRRPSKDVYLARHRAHAGDTLAPQAFPNCAVEVAALF